MRPQDAVTYRGLAPDRVDELLLSYKPSRMFNEVAQDSEGLSPKAQLLVGLPEPLILEIEPKRWKRAQW